MEGLRYYIRPEMSSFDRTAVQLQRDSVNCYCQRSAHNALRAIGDAFA